MGRITHVRPRPGFKVNVEFESEHECAYFAYAMLRHGRLKVVDCYVAEEGTQALFILENYNLNEKEVRKLIAEIFEAINDKEEEE